MSGKVVRGQHRRKQKLGAPQTNNRIWSFHRFSIHEMHKLIVSTSMHSKLPQDGFGAKTNTAFPLPDLAFPFI
jgi:hypothetical protein